MMRFFVFLNVCVVDNLITLPSVCQATREMGICSGEIPDLQRFFNISIQLQA